MEGTKKIKSTSFHQYSWNSEVQTTWISLIGWHHKTSNEYVLIMMSHFSHGVGSCRESTALISYHRLQSWILSGYMIYCGRHCVIRSCRMAWIHSWHCINRTKVPYFSICWKFQLSISLGSKKSKSAIQSGLNLSKPFWMYSAKPSFWILECCEQLCSVTEKNIILVHDTCQNYCSWYCNLFDNRICALSSSRRVLQGKVGLENL